MRHGRMKFILPFTFLFILMFGCESPKLDDTTLHGSILDNPETLQDILKDAIEEDKLRIRSKDRESLHYKPNEQTPFTGWSKKTYDNGKVKLLTQMEDGKQNGLFAYWYENGQKGLETYYKDGKRHGLDTSWHENGQRDYERNFKNGKQIGETKFFY